MEWIELISGIYLVFISIIMKTENLQSMIFFRFAPALMAFALTIDAMSRIGLV